MSKVITSPVEKWPGTVTLHDPMTLPQAAAFSAAQRRVGELGEGPRFVEVVNALMPGVYACVEKWDLKGWTAFSPDAFPWKPKKDAAQLAVWLIEEVTKVATEAEEEVPKESTGTPTPKPSASPEPAA